MNKSSYTIQLSDDKTITMVLKDFDEDINLDKILVIDYTNLLAETLTFPVILNRFGMMLADMQNKVNNLEIDLKVYESKTKEKLRSGFINKGIKFTINQIDEALILDKVWQVKKKLISKAQKNLDYVNTVYWSAKEKISLLQKLSPNITEHEIKTIKVLEYNGVKIRITS